MCLVCVLQCLTLFTNGLKVSASGGLGFLRRDVSDAEDASLTETEISFILILAVIVFFK